LSSVVSSLALSRRGNRTWLILAALVGLLGVSLLVGSAFGAVAISREVILKMIARKVGFLQVIPDWAATDETIFFQIRLPRVVTAGLVGASLAVAGVLFQGILRNPMADPYIIGTSG